MSSNGKVLTEQFTSAPLKYIAESADSKQSNRLGRLEGPGGSWKEPTRNDHLYSRRLWENVINSENFKEGMATRTIFAETDHPEERIDINIKEVAGVLTDLHLEPNGDVFTAFDILPTPNGRILKTLLDYGCQIGVSSRGLGDEVVIDGVNQIDPDTYEYYCHDFVVTPAVAKARPKLVESINKDRATKDFTELIENCSTKSQLETARIVIESTNLSNKQSIISQLDKKLSGLSASTDTQSDARDNTKQYQQNASECDNCKRLERELEKTKQVLKQRTENAKYFRRALQDKTKDADLLASANDEGLNTIAELADDANNTAKKLEVCEKAFRAREARLTEKLNQANASVSTSEQLLSTVQDKNMRLERMHKSNLQDMKALTRDNKMLEDTVNNLTEQLHQASIKLAKAEAKTQQLEKVSESKYAGAKMKLRESQRASSRTQALLREATQTAEQAKQQIVESRKELDNVKMQLTEANKQSASLKESLSQIKESSAKLLRNYIVRSCEATNLKYENVIRALPQKFSYKDVDRVVKQLSERQDRFDMLPISVASRKGVIQEHHTATGEENSFLKEALQSR